MTPSMTDVAKYVIENKDILETIIDREQTKIDHLTPTKTQKATKKEAKQAAILGKELAESICDYKLMFPPQIKVNYKSNSAITTRILQLGLIGKLGFETYQYINDFLNEVPQDHGTAILSGLAMGIVIVGAQGIIPHIKKDSYAIERNLKTGRVRVLLPKDNYETLVIGSAHEHTHEIIDEKNNIVNGNLGYKTISEGVGRVVEHIVANKLFDQTQNSQFLYEQKIRNIRNLKNTAQKVELFSNSPHNMATLDDIHDLGSSLGAIEFEKKGQQSVYDLLNLKIGN